MTTSEIPSSKTLEGLPDELLMQIISFIQPRDLVLLHKTSNRLRALTRQDPHLWRNKTIASHDEQIAEHKHRRPSIVNLLASYSDDTPPDGPVQKREEGYSRHLPPNIAAAGGRKIDWYEEWKWRFAPLRMEWLDHYPRDSSAWGGTNGGESTSDEDDYNLGSSTGIPPACPSSGMKAVDLEIRGVTAFSFSGMHGDRDMLFSPISDGSVAVFDLRSFSRRRLGQGWGDDDGDDDDWRLVGRSRPGLVSVATSSGRGSYLVGGNGGRSVGGLKTTKAPNGVVECVSVDPWSGKGWVAVEGRLIEIDLRTLLKVAEHKLPFSITALSQTSNPHPLTVCTTSSMHLYDPRVAVGDSFMNTMTAPLHQTGALSILHSNNGQATGGEDTIFLAGRFKAILAYERRMFPKMKVPMYTGTKLCTLSSFPSPASGSLAFSEGNDTPRDNASSSVEVIVAGGEYNGHGSLELYPASAINNNHSRSVPGSNGFLPSHTGAHPQLRRYNHGAVNPNLNHRQHDILHPDVTSTLTTGPRDIPAEIVRNRQSASRSKIMSVDASQGTRIVTGDADGIIRWVERDGRQEVRRYDIFEDNGMESEQPSPQFRSPVGGSRRCDGTAGYYTCPDGTTRSEVARKLIAFGDSSGSDGASQAGVVVWTGERLGVLSVGHQRLRKARNGNIRGVAIGDGEEIPADEGAERYEIEMRKTLERQCDELNIMKGLGR